MQNHHCEYGNNILGNEQDEARDVAAERIDLRLACCINFRLVDIKDGAKCIAETKDYQDEDKHAYFLFENISLACLEAKFLSPYVIYLS